MRRNLARRTVGGAKPSGTTACEESRGALAAPLRLPSYNHPMTLVIAIATWDFIVLAADRRLTWSDGSLADDNANKLVQFDDVGVWGYTGRAQTAGIGTDHWLANVMSASAREGLTPTLRAIRVAGDAVTTDSRPPLPLAFLGSCWANPEGEPPSRPIVFCTSNCYAGWEEPTCTLHPTFATHYRVLPSPHEILVTTVGTAVAPELLNACRRLVRQRVRRAHAGRIPPGVHGGELVAIAVSSIRSVAKKDPRVGRGILAACLPRPVEGQTELLIVSGPPDGDSPTFQFYPPSGAEPWTYGPVVVTRSGTVFTKFRTRRLYNG